MAIQVGMISLGCPKNQVDSEILLGILGGEGFSITAEPAEADAIIVNTCGFIEEAKQESIETILEMAGYKESGRLKCLVVTGCLAERYGEEFQKELPEADVVLGIGENAAIGRVIRDSLEQHGHLYLAGNKYDLPLSGNRILTTAFYTAYLKVAEGCDNHCTYCAIPMIRGHFRSRPMEELMQEAADLAGRGVRELVVVAQDTSRYGEDLYGEGRLPELLTALSTIDGLNWIRVLYCYPERITDSLLKVINENPKVCKYLDIPMQHCNERVLRRMNRKGSRRWLSQLVEHLREKVPGITLRTTFIAGFPGESEKEFEELCAFVGEMRFERMGCFAYSKEESTPAAQLPDQLEEKEKHRRADLIMEKQDGIALAWAEEQIGKELRTLAVGYEEERGCFIGRTEADAPEIDGYVFFFVPEGKIGSFYPVTITGVDGFNLLGESMSAEGENDHG